VSKKTVNIGVILGLVLILSGCKTFNSFNTALNYSKGKIKKFFAKLFLFETESVKFAVRVRNEFFVYLPPIKDEENKIEKVKGDLAVKLADYRVDTVLHDFLKREAKNIDEKKYQYFDGRKYKIFIEPRFVSFEYAGKTLPEDVSLNKGDFLLSMQSQIIVREKSTGKEIFRDTIKVSDNSTYKLIDYTNNAILFNSLKSLSEKTAKDVLKKLEHNARIPSQKLYASYTKKLKGSPTFQ